MDRRDVESKMAGERSGREKRSTGATYIPARRLNTEEGAFLHRHEQNRETETNEHKSKPQ